MAGWLSQFSIVSGALPVAVYVLAAVAFLLVLPTRSRRRQLILLGSAAVGAAIGLVLGWLVSDVWNSFGVSLSVPTRLWLAAATTATAVAVAVLSAGGVRLWRRVLAGCAIPLFLLAGGVGINGDLGEFPTVGELFGQTSLRHVALPQSNPSPDPTSSPAAASLAEWRPPAGLPIRGRVGTVVIPATASHFTARDAIVYLPPAALVPNAPALPVLELLSGQPGAPSNLITSGQLPGILDAYALAHHGLAPIVVIPDQLGAPQNNPMCVDSPLGNSASYLTVDVPAWIRAHLKVLSDRSDWAIGGFSQGGTCSIQLGAKYSSLFGSILDISGQVVPHRGSTAATIRDAFGGSTARYQAAMPLSLLTAGTPYSDTVAIFVSGQNDARFTPGAILVAKAAAAAGMTVHSFVSPGTAHDWHTVQYALRVGIPLLGTRWGL